MLPRWERHWWEYVVIQRAVEREPTVWVDPSLYVEPPPPIPRHRVVRGSTPPPAVIGAYCTVRPRFRR